MGAFLDKLKSFTLGVPYWESVFIYHRFKEKAERLLESASDSSIEMPTRYELDLSARLFREFGSSYKLTCYLQVARQLLEDGG